MSNRTIESLFEASMADDWDRLSMGAEVDYFGSHNIKNQENMNIIFGLYIGMIRLKENTRKGVKEDKNKFHKACVDNKLDDLIDDFYKNRQSGYYILYKQKNIKVKNSFG